MAGSSAADCSLPCEHCRQLLRAKFKLPPGFEIQFVASEPEIQKPMNLAFDTRGRLWVTHSVEYPFAAAPGTTPRDGLTVLEGFGPDGRATKATLFADGLNIPIGVLPLPVGNADGRGQEVRIAAGDIDEVAVSRLSPTVKDHRRPLPRACCANNSILALRSSFCAHMPAQAATCEVRGLGDV